MGLGLRSVFALNHHVGLREALIDVALTQTKPR
jgi:hypothetical protein